MKMDPLPSENMLPKEDSIFVAQQQDTNIFVVAFLLGG